MVDKATDSAPSLPLTGFSRDRQAAVMVPASQRGHADLRVEGGAQGSSLSKLKSTELSSGFFVFFFIKKKVYLIT